MSLNTKNERLAVTSCVVAVSGTVLLSATQPAQAAREQGGFRNFHHQNGVNQQRLFNYVRHQSFQTTDAGTVKLNNGVDLDLTSQMQNITLGKNLFDGANSISITVGDETKTLSAGARVTAAEYVAAKQVLNGGAQKLVLNGAGKAVGGEVDLGALTSDNDVMRASALVIAKDVTTYGDFGKRSDFRLLGDLDNFGTVQALSSNANVHGGTIRAVDIANHNGASINSSVDLTLHASGNLSNDGSISSDQQLTLVAEGALHNSGSIVAAGTLNTNSASIRNSGLMQSTNGSITFEAPAGQALVVNNVRGTINAAGAINLRGTAYDGTDNSNLFGGNLLSNELNIHSGKGLAEVNVNQLTGLVNETGSAAHLMAATDVLNLGKVCLTGDPTFYNTAGSINITADVIFNEDIVIAAAGDITASANAKILSGDTSSGHNITLIAGAAITPTSGKNSPTLPPLTDNGGIQLSGKASKTGGAILFNNNTVTIDTRAQGASGDAAAGNLFMFAFGTNTGIVDISKAVVLTGGQNNGTNGNIQIIAALKKGVSITTGDIDTTGSTATVPNGTLSLFAGAITPFPKGSIVEYDAFGSIVGTPILTTLKRTSGDIVLESTAVTPDILVNGLFASTNGKVDVQADVTSLGAVTFFSNGGAIAKAGIAPIVAGLGVTMVSNGKGSFGTDTDAIPLDTNQVLLQTKGSLINVTDAGSGSLLIFDSFAKDSVTIKAPGRTVTNNFPIAAKTVFVESFRYTTLTPQGSTVKVKTTDKTFDITTAFAAGTLTLISAGSIGTAGNNLQFGTQKAVRLQAGGSVFAEQTGKKAIDFQLAAGTDVDFKAHASTIISQGSALNGKFNALVDQKGTLTIDGNILAANLIDLQNTGPSGSKIVINANMDTLAPVKPNGNINISVGPTSGTKLPTPPTGITVNVLTTGSANFFGFGAKAKAPVTFQLKGADINVNNGLSQSSLTFNGPITITADPILQGPSDAIFSSAPSDIEVVPTTVEQSAHGAMIVLSSNVQLFGSNQTTLSVLPQVVTQVPQFESSRTPIVDLNTLSNDTTANVLTASTVNSIAMSSNCIDLSPDDSVMMMAQPASFEVNAELSTDLSFGGTPVSANQELSNGIVLFCPTHDMIVNTPAGNVMIAGGSVALISVGSNHLSVYDLFDQAKGSVVVESNGKKLALSPGRHITVTHDRVLAFSDVNPVEPVPHRALVRHDMENGKCLFASEFSIVQAVDAVKPLKAIFQSKNKDARKLAERLMKTTAVLLHVAPSQQRFELHTAPRRVALK